MLIQEMSREGCFAALTGRKIGRLACIREGQPYVVRIYFIHDRPTAELQSQERRTNKRYCVPPQNDMEEYAMSGQSVIPSKSDSPATS